MVTLKTRVWAQPWLQNGYELHQGLLETWTMPLTPLGSLPIPRLFDHGQACARVSVRYAN